ncbi:MAG: bifunctional glutamate N-acetyltransferase/amino-acid acetyltransferase ArgJ [Oscillospiraceae bacterium]|nr:bifunctional glutamate N-acetyltransferase/amino-acid acetyltransferase ArgJ [Oscillospiraceae bacterium]
MVKFEGYNFVDGGVCAAEGFAAAGVIAGIKKGNTTKRDLALIYCAEKCKAAALYTTNKVKGAPIYVTKKHLENGVAQAVIVNSGNANTCNDNGIEIAEKMCKLAADALKIKVEDVLVGSTGVIGQPLSIEPIEAKMEQLVSELSPKKSSEACEAIMTTDTRKKELAVEFQLDGRTCHVGGISKGSGMIHPNMATMLAFITTDVAIKGELLEKALRKVNSLTYNMVSVDGDTSTNDTLVLMSSGLAKNAEINCEDKNYEIFVNALYAVMMNLARETARDGEGATRLLECIVTGAPTEEIARSVAKSVIGSSLVKAAMFASDANWGRILCAIGYAEGDFDISKVSVELASDKKGKITVCVDGAGISFSEETASDILSDDEVKVLIDMHSGDASAIAWGCDLTFEYVKINAEYRT